MSPLNPLSPPSRLDPVISAPVVRAQSHWPPPDDPMAVLPAAGRFTGSSFPLLVAAVGERCLRGLRGDIAPRTALLLVTMGADAATINAVESAAASGAPVPKPLLFQSVPTASIGYIAALWGLTGPVLSIAPTGEPGTDGTAFAAQLLTTGEADEVLLIVADQGPDRAHAQLLGPP